MLSLCREQERDLTRAGAGRLDEKPASGRPHATSRKRLSVLGIELFVRDGFENTSIDQIADAAGISRRTFFSYFESKADVVWGDFDDAVDRLHLSLQSSAPDLSLMDAIRMAVVEFNTFPTSELAQHRRRMTLILTVPALTARSTLRYTQWRQAIEAFASSRLGLPAGHLLPRAIGHCALGAALSAYEQWLLNEGDTLEELLDEAFQALARGFSYETLEMRSTIQQMRGL